MSIAFERQGGELILILAPERIYTHEIVEMLNKGDEWRISHSFVVYKSIFVLRILSKTRFNFVSVLFTMNIRTLIATCLAQNTTFTFPTPLSCTSVILSLIAIYQFLLKLIML